jgi:hypothetical protein
MKKSDPLTLSAENRTILVVGSDASKVSSRVATLIKNSQAEFRNSGYAVVGSSGFKDAVSAEVGNEPVLHYDRAEEVSQGNRAFQLVLLGDLLVVEDFGSPVGGELLYRTVASKEVDVIGCLTVETTKKAERLLSRVRRPEGSGNAIPVISVFTETETADWTKRRRPEFVVC